MKLSKWQKKKMKRRESFWAKLKSIKNKKKLREKLKVEAPTTDNVQTTLPIQIIRKEMKDLTEIKEARSQIMEENKALKKTLKGV